MLQDCLIYAQLLVPGLVSQLICFCAIWLLVVQPHDKLSIGSWMTRVGEIRQSAAPTVRGTNSVSGSKISVRTRAESTASETQCTPVHLKNTIKVVHFPPYLSPRTLEFYSQKSQISVDFLTRPPTINSWLHCFQKSYSPCVSQPTWEPQTPCTLQLGSSHTRPVSNAWIYSPMLNRLLLHVLITYYQHQDNASPKHRKLRAS